MHVGLQFNFRQEISTPIDKSRSNVSPFPIFSLLPFSDREKEMIKIS
jgi:hypothetical protein